MRPLPTHSSSAEVWGGTVIGIVQGMEAAGYPEMKLRDLLRICNLPVIEVDGWYALNRFLLFLKEAEAAFGADALRAGGRAIPTSAKFPPDLDSLTRGLQMLDVAYQVNHRKGAIGRYRCTELTDGRAVMICENPYPCALDQGIVERLIAEFVPSGLQGTVTHVAGKPCRCQGGRACHLEVRWWHGEP
jgi:hypothetical protein